MVKEAQAYSLDPDLKAFVNTKQWDYKMNRSQIINAILRYLKENLSELDEIIKKHKKGLK